MSHVNWLQWHAEFSCLRSEPGTVSVCWYGRRRFWLGSEHGTRSEPIRLAVYGVGFDPHNTIANLLLFRKKKNLYFYNNCIHSNPRTYSTAFRTKICMYVAPRLPRPLTRSNCICQQLAHAEQHVSMSVCAPDSVRVQCAVSPVLARAPNLPSFLLTTWHREEGHFHRILPHTFYCDRHVMLI
jgi:hypothetical protein